MNYGFAFFPGQGAQAPGMGKDLYENSQAAKLVFEEASEGAGLDVAKLCFERQGNALPHGEQPDRDFHAFHGSMGCIKGSRRGIQGSGRLLAR